MHNERITFAFINNKQKVIVIFMKKKQHFKLMALIKRICEFLKLNLTY
jgi:hypothetical protein